MGTPHDVGTNRCGVTAHDLAGRTVAAAAVDLLATHDDQVLRHYLDGTPIAPPRSSGRSPSRPPGRTSYRCTSAPR